MTASKVLKLAKTRKDFITVIFDSNTKEVIHTFIGLAPSRFRLKSGQSSRLIHI